MMGRRKKTKGTPDRVRCALSVFRLPVLLVLRRDRGGQREEVLLALALVHQLHRLAERRVEAEGAALGGGVAAHDARDTLLEQTIDVAARRIVLRAIARHALGG